MISSIVRVASSRQVSHRRSRIAELGIAIGLLSIVGLAACSDSQTNWALQDLGGTSGPSALAPLLLDSAGLRALSAHAVSVGARVLVAADTGDSHSVPESSVSIRDTSIVGIDGQGMLYALTVGKTWVTWSAGEVGDSSLVTVTASDEPTDQQPTYVEPAPPKATVDVRYPVGRTRTSGTNKTWKVAAGGNLQEALNDAQPGDEIVLASGATFTGNFVLPAKQNSGTSWIILRAEVVGVSAGTRMTPEQAAGAARIVTPNQDPALKTAVSARHWRLVGFQIEHASKAEYNFGILVLGRGDEKSVELQPSDIVLDRMYIHGATDAASSRCIAFNGRSLAVIDSWISECHAKGYDSQGICGWSGGGPFLIENNFIEGSGQAIMFGGADPAIRNVSPSDITIRHNYLYKPLSWSHGLWTVKAAFELKHARRVLFEGNVIENHWIDGQSGFAVLFQTLSDNNSAWEWTTIQDVMVRDNIIKNSTGGANINGRVAYGGGKLPTNPTARIVLQNNLWQEVGRDPISGMEGRNFMLLGDHHDVSLVNNTFTLTGRSTYAILFDGTPAVATTVINNVFTNTEYGIFGSGSTIGTNSLNTYLPGAVVVGNVLPGQESFRYPGANFFPPTVMAMDGVVSDRVCQQTKTWAAAASIPVGVGANCDILEQAVRTTLSAIR